MKISPVAVTPWHLQIWGRMKSHFFLKTVGISIFMWGFFTAYFYLLKHPLYPVTIMPLTALDRAVNFTPQALFLYASLWLYVTFPPGLQANRRELIFYGLAVGVLCLAGLAFFLFWPTAIPLTSVDWAQHVGFSILKEVDASGNACPSLHVATAVFSGMWLNQILTEVNAPRLLRILNWIWCIGIAYSTLATKQHVALDMIAGAALGMGVALLSLQLLRRSRRTP